MYDYRSRLEATFPAPINAKTSRGTDKNLIDAFGGVRYLVPIGKRWDFVARGDVGTGGSDLSWNAHASFGVRLGKTDLFNLRFGWRYMELDVTKDAQPLEHRHGERPDAQRANHRLCDEVLGGRSRDA